MEMGKAQAGASPFRRSRATGQDFGNLDGVECRALAQIVAHDEQREPMLDCRIAADTPDENRIGTRSLQWIGHVADSTPGAFRRRASACEGLIARSNSALIESEWPVNT